MMKTRHSLAAIFTSLASVVLAHPRLKGGYLKDVYTPGFLYPALPVWVPGDMAEENEFYDKPEWKKNGIFQADLFWSSSTKENMMDYTQIDLNQCLGSQEDGIIRWERE